MGRQRTNNTGRITLAVWADPLLVEKWLAKIKDSGLSEREYVRQLIAKDVGLKYIPAHYVEADGDN